MDQQCIISIADPGNPGLQFGDDVIPGGWLDCAIALKEQLAIVEGIASAVSVFGEVEFQACGGWGGLGFDFER